MKISTPQSLLFTLVLSGMGFVAVGLNSFGAPNQGFQAKPAQQGQKPAQQGHGHAPHQPLAATLAKRPAQQGYGHTPHQPLAATLARVGIQQGYGHAPYPPVDSK